MSETLRDGSVLSSALLATVRNNQHVTAATAGAVELADQPLPTPALAPNGQLMGASQRVLIACASPSALPRTAPGEHRRGVTLERQPLGRSSYPHPQRRGRNVFGGRVVYARTARLYRRG